MTLNLDGGEATAGASKACAQGEKVKVRRENYTNKRNTHNTNKRNTSYTNKIKTSYKNRRNTHYTSTKHKIQSHTLF